MKVSLRRWWLLVREDLVCVAHPSACIHKYSYQGGGKGVFCIGESKLQRGVLVCVLVCMYG